MVDPLSCYTINVAQIGVLSTGINCFAIIAGQEKQQHGIVFFSAEIHPLAAPTLAAVMNNAFPVAVVVNSTRKLPELITKVVSATTHSTVPATPIIAAELYIAVKSMLI
jgi:hypothetical protein